MRTLMACLADFGIAGAALLSAAGLWPVPAAAAEDTDLIGALTGAISAFVANLEARQADLPGFEIVALAALVAVAGLFVLSRFGVFRLFTEWAVHKARQRMSTARGEIASVFVDFLRVATIIGGFAVVLIGIHAAIQLSGP